MNPIIGIVVDMISSKLTRRSLTFPKELTSRIDDMAKKYSYKYKNELYTELLELGILKFDEDVSLKNMILNLLSKVEELIEVLNGRQ